MSSGQPPNSHPDDTNNSGPNTSMEPPANPSPSSSGDLVQQQSSLPLKSALKSSSPRRPPIVPLLPSNALVSQQQQATAGGSNGSGFDSSPRGRSPPKYASPRGETTRRRRPSHPSATTTNQVDLPVTFQRVVNYFIDSTPPGQLSIVVNSCREILLRALSTIDSSNFVAAVGQAAEKACLGRAERYAERELAVIPFVNPMEDNGHEDEFDGYKSELKKRWAHSACVVSRATRGQARKTPYWYLFIEGRCGVQIDPIRRRIIDIVPVNPSLEWITSDDLSKLDHPHRVEMESILRQQYLPRHYPISSNTAFSVHLSDSFSFFPSSTTGSPNGSQTSRSTSRSPTPSSTQSPIETPPGQSPPRRGSLPSSQLATGCIRLQIIIAAENINSANFWGGSWKSIWEIDFDPTVERSATLKGKLKVKLQYTEDGSICVRQQMTMHHDIEHTQDPKAFAGEVVNVISEGERRLQRALEKLYLALHVEVLRSLRRLVPVAGCKFDWSGGHQTMTNDIAAMSASRQLNTIMKQQQGIPKAEEHPNRETNHLNSEGGGSREQMNGSSDDMGVLFTEES